jgi:hypothetical protein
LINNRQNGRRRGRGGGAGAPRPNGGNGGNGGNRIDNRARGNAAQLHEKYKTLARDAQMQGDRVNTEYYLQFADHYFRVLNENRSRFEEQQQQRQRRDDYLQQMDGDDEDYGDEADGNMASPASSDPRMEASMGSDAGFTPRQGVEGEPTGDRGDRQDRRGRRDRDRDRDRGPRLRFDREPQAEAETAPPPAAPEPVQAPVAEASEEAPRPRRGRPRKVVADAAPTIEADRLPPSFTLTPPGEAANDPVEKPSRRTRRAATDAATDA